MPRKINLGNAAVEPFQNSDMPGHLMKTERNNGPLSNKFLLPCAINDAKERDLANQLKAPLSSLMHRSRMLKFVGTFFFTPIYCGQTMNDLKY